MRYFLGIDNGGTATKAAIYDETGKEVAVAASATQMICERAGFAERNMAEMWKTNCKVISQVLERSGIAPQELSGIACCGHGKGLYLLDQNGQPVRNAILSADTRAEAYVKRWREDGTEKKAYQYSLQHIMASQPVALLAWLRDNEPECAKRIAHILSCKDYIRYMLTGEIGAELSDISGTGLLDLNTKDYSGKLLKLFGIDFVQDALAPLKGSLALCGQVTERAAGETGLAAGTPVFGGMFDINACALAVGAITPKDLCMIAGTWSINEYVSEQPILEERIQMNSLFCLDGKYLIEESSATSAGNSEWLLTQAICLEPEGGRSIYDRANELAESLDEREPLPIYLPFLMASNVNPDAMGAFIGLSRNHTQAHLVRSVYEGVAFSHRWHLHRLKQVRTELITEIRLSGGAARSNVWTQMFADILGYPIRSVQVQETGAFGCAIAAAAASGCYPSVEAAIQGMVKPSDLVYPRKEYREHYDRRYAMYLATIQSLDGVWNMYRTGAES